MAFCRLVFPLLVLSAICVSSSNVPVFIWGDIAKTSVKSNPLSAVSTADFEDLLNKELSNAPLTVVFIEETLSVEDLSLKNEEGESVFSFLHGSLNDALYLPSVHNALRAVNKIADPSESDHIKLTENGLSEEISPNTDESGKFLFINLKDAKVSESRADMLQRHDAFMQKTLERLQDDNGKVAAIYTAHFPSWTIPESHSRSRRAVTARNDANTYAMDGLRLYVSSINVMTGNDTFALAGYTGATSNITEAGTMETKMTFSNASLTLDFYNKGGYWFFNSVSLELPTISHTDVLSPVEEVYAILGFSYRCGESISFTGVNETKTYTVTFKDMKVQPFFETSNTTQEFGDSFNCVGFFTAPIWAGLFVVFILLLITFYGIMMMLDIRTMDRFDDPKGKTITINAAE